MLEYMLSFSRLFIIRNITSKCAEDEVAPANKHIVVRSVLVLYLIISTIGKEALGSMLILSTVPCNT